MLLMTENLRFGLIGFGAWGQCHANAIASTGGAELTAICAHSDESKKRAAEQYPGARIFGSFDEIAACEEVDAIDIVLPAYLHHEAATAALGAGKHLLLEKPMALTVEHCQEMKALAESKGLVFAIGHEFRLSSQWGAIRKIIDDGVIGSPHYTLVELSRKPYRGGSGGWRSDIDKVGNWILEEPLHFFDLARWYFTSHGDPASVFGAANSIQPGHPELQDNFSAIVRWENGPYAVISQTLCAFEHHQTVKISGDKGAVWAGWSGALDRTDSPDCFLKVFDGNEVVDHPLEKASGEIFELRSEIEMMVRCVRDGETPIATAEDGLWSAAMCLAAQQSVDENREIAFTDFSQR